MSEINTALDLLSDLVSLGVQVGKPTGINYSSAPKRPLGQSYEPD